MWLFNFIPVIGPLLQGLVGPVFNGLTSLLGKYWDNKTAQLQVETQGSVEIIKATEADWGVRLARDVLIWPWAAWGGAYGWDTLVALNHPHWMLHVADPPASVAYMPYAVIVFLLGNIGLNMWRSK